MYYVGYVAYFQLNLDYIVDTYCVNKDVPELKCNGKCHLAKQLSVASNTTDETAVLNTISEAFYPLYYQEFVFKSAEIQFYKTNKPSFYYALRNYTSFLQYSFKPPQV